MMPGATKTTTLHQQHSAPFDGAEVNSSQDQQNYEPGAQIILEELTDDDDEDADYVDAPDDLNNLDEEDGTVDKSSANSWRHRIVHSPSPSLRTNSRNDAVSIDSPAFRANVSRYAKYIGVSEDDEALIWLVKEGMRSRLPEDWVAVEDSHSGQIYYVNLETRESTWEHPCDQYYRKLAGEHLEERRRKQESQALPLSPSVAAGATDEDDDKSINTQKLALLSIDDDDDEEEPKTLSVVSAHQVHDETEWHDTTDLVVDGPVVAKQSHRTLRPQQHYLLTANNATQQQHSNARPVYFPSADDAAVLPTVEEEEYVDEEDEEDDDEESAGHEHHLLCPPQPTHMVGNKRNKSQQPRGVIPATPSEKTATGPINEHDNNLRDRVQDELVKAIWESIQEKKRLRDRVEQDHERKLQRLIKSYKNAEARIRKEHASKIGSMKEKVRSELDKLKQEQAEQIGGAKRAYDSQIKQLAASLEQHRRDAQEQESLLEQRLWKLKQQIDWLESRKETLDRELHELRDEETGTRSRCDELKDKVDKLEREFKSAEQSLDKLESTRVELEEDMAFLKRTRQRYQVKVGALRSVVDPLGSGDIYGGTRTDDSRTENEHLEDASLQDDDAEQPERHEEDDENEEEAGLDQKEEDEEENEEDAQSNTKRDEEAEADRRRAYERWADTLRRYSELHHGETLLSAATADLQQNEAGSVPDSDKTRYLRVSDAVKSLQKSPTDATLVGDNDEEADSSDWSAIPPPQTRPTAAGMTSANTTHLNMPVKATAPANFSYDKTTPVLTMPTSPPPTIVTHDESSQFPSSNAGVDDNSSQADHSERKSRFLSPFDATTQPRTRSTSPSTGSSTSERSVSPRRRRYYDSNVGPGRSADVPSMSGQHSPSSPYHSYHSPSSAHTSSSGVASAIVDTYTPRLRTAELRADARRRSGGGPFSALSSSSAANYIDSLAGGGNASHLGSASSPSHYYSPSSGDHYSNQRRSPIQHSPSTNSNKSSLGSRFLNHIFPTPPTSSVDRLGSRSSSKPSILGLFRHS